MFRQLQESFFWVSLERGFLVLQGRHAGRELRVQSERKVSLVVRWFKRFLNSVLLFHFPAVVLTLCDSVSRHRTKSFPSKSGTSLAFTTAQCRSLQMTSAQITKDIISGGSRCGSERGTQPPANQASARQTSRFFLSTDVFGFQTQHHSSGDERMHRSPELERRHRRFHHNDWCC